MSIQKITNLQNRKTTSKNLASKQNSTNPQAKPQANETELKKSEALKNNFLSGISFKGYSSEYSKHAQLYNGTSGNLVYIGSDDINHSSGKKVTKGESAYICQTNYEARAKVYYADPNETVTPEIKKGHSFIVEYTEPPLKNITKEQIDNVSSTSGLVEIIGSLEMTKKQLEIQKNSSAKRLEKAQSKLDIALEDYQKAKTELEAAKEENATASEELEVTENNLRLAQSKVDAIKEQERRKFMLREKINKLQEIKTKLEELGNDESIKAISAQIQEYMEELKQGDK